MFTTAREIGTFAIDISVSPIGIPQIVMFIFSCLNSNMWFKGIYSCNNIMHGVHK